MQVISIMHLRSLLQCGSADYAHVEQVDNGSIETTSEKNRTVTDETSSISSLFETIKQAASHIFSTAMECIRSFVSYISSFGTTSSFDSLNPLDNDEYDEDAVERTVEYYEMLKVPHVKTGSQ